MWLSDYDNDDEVVVYWKCTCCNETWVHDDKEICGACGSDADFEELTVGEVKAIETTIGGEPLWH